MKTYNVRFYDTEYFVAFTPGLRAQFLVNNGVLFTWPNQMAKGGNWKQQYVSTKSFAYSVIFSTDGVSFEKQVTRCGDLVVPFLVIS